MMTATSHRVKRQRRDRGHTAMYRSWADSLLPGSAAASLEGAPGRDGPSASVAELIRSHHLAYVARDALEGSGGDPVGFRESAEGTWRPVATPGAGEWLGYWNP